MSEVFWVLQCVVPKVSDVSKRHIAPILREKYMPSKKPPEAGRMRSSVA
jgi:hypothetical protein